MSLVERNNKGGGGRVEFAMEKQMIERNQDEPFPWNFGGNHAANQKSVKTIDTWASGEGE